MADTPQAKETSITEHLRTKLLLAQTYLQKPDIPVGMLAMWSGSVRFQLEKIYGKSSPFLNALPGTGIDRSIADPRAELVRRVEQVQRIIEVLEAATESIKTPLFGKKIFIGHGRSLVWLQLKDFIREKIGIPCDEFNIEPAAGISTTSRLESMLEQAGFAFVIMTAEEGHADGKTYARPNVIHESGLFQGKLGTRRAIILLEEGCSAFSNIAGLTQIRFPQGDLKPVFNDIREVLEREGFK